MIGLEPMVDKIVLGTISLGNFRLGTGESFAWNFHVILRLGASVWERSLRVFGSGTFTWELSLEVFAWSLPFGI